MFTNTIKNMIEQLFKSADGLKKHLSAPLLREREEYLSICYYRHGMSVARVHDVECVMMCIVEYLHLEDNDGRKVSPSELLAAANEWSVRDVGMFTASKGKYRAPWAFTSVAVEWLGHARRLDNCFSDNVIINRLQKRIHNRIQMLAAPMLEERIAYLEHMETQGICPDSIQYMSCLQIHAIGMLNLQDGHTVTWEEIENAAKSWQGQTSKNGRGCSNLLLKKHIFKQRIVNWLVFMNRMEDAASSITVQRDALVEEYLKMLSREKGFSPKTVERHRYLLMSFKKYLSSKGISLLALKASDIDDYIAERDRTGKVKRQTMVSYISSLRCFLRYASSRGLCKPELSFSLYAPRVYQQETLPSYMPWDKVLEMISMAKSESGASGIRKYAILLMLSAYGIRASELTGLLLSDIDWAGETITVRRAKGCRPQVFPLIQTAGNALLDYLMQSRDNSSTCRHVFLSIADSSQPMSVSELHSLVSGLQRKLGVRLNRYGPHSIRHSRATQMVNTGHTLKDVADLLGHRQLESTRIYAKVNLTSLREVSDMNWEGIL